MSAPAGVPTVRLGTSDLEVGAIAYGCWRLAEGDVHAADTNIRTALDCGMTLIDTADVYGLDSGRAFGAAEELLGEVLAASPGLRNRLVLATKGGIVPGVPYDSSGLVRAAEASLRRLHTDVIDLYQVHRPDLLTHPAEVAAALSELVRSGKVRHVGVSNYTPTQVEALGLHLEVRLCTVQPEFSVLALAPLDDGTLDQAMALHVTPLAWSPLGGGRLMAPPDGDARLAAVQAVLDDLAARHGVDRAAVALAFVRRHPSGPVPIIGTQRPDRIRAAVAATAVPLERADWYRIVAAAGRPLP